MPALHALVLVSHLVHGQEGVRQELLNGSTVSLPVDLEHGKELLSDIEEGVLGPGLEPIDDGAVNDGGELESTVPEVISDRGEGKTHVEVLTNLPDEELKAIFPVGDDSSCLDTVCDSIDNGVNLIDSEEVRNDTRSKQVIEVNEEPLIHDLRVGKKEHNSLLFDPRLVVHDLEVLFEVIDTIGARNDNLVHGVSTDEGREARKGLLSGPSDSYKEGVATLIEHDANNASNVAHSILEEDQVHGSVGLVVLLKGTLENVRHVTVLKDLVVHLIRDVLGEVAEDEGIGILVGVELGNGEGGEDLLTLLLSQSVVLSQVFRAHKTVTINALGLMQPKKDKLLCCLELIRFGN
mmetsp:Transcript_1310/g.2319  ORF Transcript_1310/g.2319 Transcript_1310/m.2319 type:complete len:350 (-) Transcript_1310:6629-7678(-)